MTATHAVYDQNKIMRLEAEIERLRAALKPFADWYEQYQWGEYPRDMILPDERHVAAWDAAREALRQPRRLTPPQTPGVA